MMKRKNLLVLTVGLISSLFLVACGAAAGTEADAPSADNIPVVVDNFSISAEGRIVPADSVNLSFNLSGEVAEILVEEGDIVQAGDIIARLGDREAFEAAIAGAELELEAAKIEQTGLDLERTGAELELLNARQALDLINENWPTQATAAQEALKNARQAVYDSERNLGYLISPASQSNIDAASAQVVLARDALDKAKDDYEPYEDKPEDNLRRALLQQRLAEAQQIYDRAVRQYNALVDTTNEFDLSQSEATVRIAQARLDQAQEDYDKLVEGPDPDDVAIAEARIATAESRLASIDARAGLLDARIRAAEASLASVQANLDNLDLTATIDGTIVELDLIVGQDVNPGVPVVLVADFSSWYVETDNLTEIEVVDVTLDQNATIVPDALPELAINGHVTKIQDVFEEKRGDITYTTRVQLDESDPRLRWGMTVVVTFEK